MEVYQNLREVTDGITAVCGVPVDQLVLVYPSQVIDGAIFQFKHKFFDVFVATVRIRFKNMVEFVQGQPFIAAVFTDLSVKQRTAVLEMAPKQTAPPEVVVEAPAPVDDSQL